MDRIGVGLWGCGNMGSSLAKALAAFLPAATGEAEFVGYYDLLPERAEALASAYGGQAARSADEFLGLPGLSAVIVAVPGYVHKEATVAAAEAGKHIFVEKPMSLSTADCVAMIQAAARNGVKLQVGQVLRYYEPYRSILRWKAEERWGRPFAASFWRLSDGRRWEVPGYWRAERGKSGGYIMEVGAHELDMLRCLLGRPLSVSAAMSKVIPRRHQMEDYISVQVRFPGGRSASYEGGGGLSVSRYGFRLYFESATFMSDAAFRPSAMKAYDQDGNEITLNEEDFSAEPPVQAELADWLAAIRGEREVAIPGSEGLATVALAEAAYCSAETGMTVEFKLPEVGG